MFEYVGDISENLSHWYLDFIADIADSAKCYIRWSNPYYSNRSDPCDHH